MATSEFVSGDTTLKAFSGLQHSIHTDTLFNATINFIIIIMCFAYLFSLLLSFLLPLLSVSWWWRGERGQPWPGLSSLPGASSCSAPSLSASRSPLCAGVWVCDGRGDIRKVTIEHFWLGFLVTLCHRHKRHTFLSSIAAWAHPARSASPSWTSAPLCWGSQFLSSPPHLLSSSANTLQQLIQYTLIAMNVALN